MHQKKLKVKHSQSGFAVVNGAGLFVDIFMDEHMRERLVLYDDEKIVKVLIIEIDEKEHD